MVWSFGGGVLARECAARLDQVDSLDGVVQGNDTVRDTVQRRGRQHGPTTCSRAARHTSERMGKSRQPPAARRARATRAGPSGTESGRAGPNENENEPGPAGRGRALGPLGLINNTSMGTNNNFSKVGMASRRSRPCGGGDGGSSSTPSNPHFRWLWLCQGVTSRGHTAIAR